MHTHDSITSFSRVVAEARRRRGLTQSELAATVGCQQSAVSMLERGNLQALAYEKQKALAAFLGLSCPPEPVTPQSDEVTGTVSGFCPHFDCPANYPYVSAGRLLAIPRSHALSPGTYCRYCGEVCETRCPGCQVPYQPGACCADCGTPYIAVPAALHDTAANATWLYEQQRLITQLS